MMKFFVHAAMPALVLGSALMTTTPGHADANAAVCAFGYGKNDGLACNYADYDQCKAAVSGLSATCVGNPDYRAARNQVLHRRGQR